MTATVEPVPSSIRITHYAGQKHRTVRFFCACGASYAFYPPTPMPGPKCPNCNRELGEFFLDAIAEYVKSRETR